MAFLTNDKLVIVGAAGMIGSNMAQTALMMGLTSNVCLYDVFSPEGVAEEMRQSGFGDVKITATTDAKEAFTNIILLNNLKNFIYLKFSYISVSTIINFFIFIFKMIFFNIIKK